MHKDGILMCVCEGYHRCVGNFLLDMPGDLWGCKWALYLSRDVNRVVEGGHPEVNSEISHD